jgi:transcription antitermination factor NusG
LTDPIAVTLVAPLACGLDGGFGWLEGWWRLARVRPNADRRLSADLVQQGVPHYAAMAEWVEVDPAGKRRHATRPLFPGYLFVAGHFAGGNRVLKVEPIADQARVVADLERLEALRLAGRPLLEEPTYTHGDLVEITRGPYTGVSGVVVRRGGKARLVVEIATLGRLLSLELDARHIRRVSSKAGSVA